VLRVAGLGVLVLAAWFLLTSEPRADEATKRRKALESKERIEQDNPDVKRKLDEVRAKYRAIGVDPSKIKYTKVSLRKLTEITGLKTKSATMRAKAKRSVRGVVEVSLPSRFDLREKLKANDSSQALRVGDQDRCGCCWDFAGVGAYEGSYMYKGLGRNPGL